MPPLLAATYPDVVFNSLGWGEMAALMLLALFIFGPERLPGYAKDFGRLIRTLRDQARGYRDELKAELGPEVGDLDLRSLHPKAFLQKALFEEDDETPAPAKTAATPPTRSEPGVPGPSLPSNVEPPLTQGERPPWDADAT